KEELMAPRHSSTPAQRAQIAVQLLAHAGEYGTVTALQQQYTVSRPTLSSWRTQAQAALQAVFAPAAPAPPRALERAILALLVVGHASRRAIQALLSELGWGHVSLGTIAA